MPALEDGEFTLDWKGVGQCALAGQLLLQGCGPES